jgi:3-oxoacyl-[acyl-carrier protein] reductase
MKETSKSVIITGANKGIGLASVKKFLLNNYKVFCCTRIKDQKNLMNNLEVSDNLLKNIIPIYLDLESEKSIIDAVEEIKKTEYEINGLINNAGTIETKLFLMSKINDIKDMFQTNFFSNLLFTQLIIKIFIKQKFGNIVNISSTASQDPIPGRLAYSSIKSAIDISSKILSKELGPFNIRVNSVAPGLTDTDLMKNSHKKENVDKMVKNLSIKRVARPAEIANLIFFLISNESSYVTGQVLRVDGGMQ